MRKGVSIESLVSRIADFWQRQHAFDRTGPYRGKAYDARELAGDRREIVCDCVRFQCEFPAQSELLNHMLMWVCGMSFGCPGSVRPYLK
jgi:hypothetical protein